MRISDWSSDVCSSDLRCSQADGRYKIMARKLVFSRIFYPAQAQWQSYLRVPSHQSRKTCRQDATADCIPSPRSKPHRVRRYRVAPSEICLIYPEYSSVHINGKQQTCYKDRKSTRLNSSH